MPELTHDTAEDGFHELELSGKQLVFLFMMATVVLVAVFLCGVLVGRNARSPREGEPIETVAVPAPPTPSTSADAGPPATEPPAPPPELSFHKRLESSKPLDEPKPKAEAPAPAPQPPAKLPAEKATLDVPTSGKPGSWFVQVIALQNRGEAANVVKGLIAKGYPAYLEMPAAGAPSIYRVRVGRYKDRRDAEQAARRLKENKLTAEVRR